MVTILVAKIQIDFVLKYSLDDIKLGIVLEERISWRYPEQKLSDLASADVRALVDNTKEKMQKATDEIQARSANAGLIISVQERLNLSIKNKPEDKTANILGSEPLENTKCFTYLGSTLSYNASLCTDLTLD